MKVVAVYAIKGGVGKTAVSVNLAHAAAATGRETLLWDLDEQGGASLIVGRGSADAATKLRRSSRLAEHVAPSAWPGVSIVPSESLVHLLDRHDRPKRLRELLDSLDGFERVIVDCPPTLGYVAQQIFELADLIVVPIVPASLSAAAFEQLRTHLAASSGRKPPLLPILSLVDRRRRVHREAIEAEPGRIAIPYAAAMERMADTHLPVALAAPRSPAVAPLAALWEAVDSLLEDKQAGQRAKVA